MARKKKNKKNRNKNKKPGATEAGSPGAETVSTPALTENDTGEKILRSLSRLEHRVGSLAAESSRLQLRTAVVSRRIESLEGSRKQPGPLTDGPSPSVAHISSRTLLIAAVALLVVVLGVVTRDLLTTSDELAKLGRDTGDLQGHYQEMARTLASIETSFHPVRKAAEELTSSAGELRDARQHLVAMDGVLSALHETADTVRGDLLASRRASEQVSERADDLARASLPLRRIESNLDDLEQLVTPLRTSIDALHGAAIRMAEQPDPAEASRDVLQSMQGELQALQITMTKLMRGLSDVRAEVTDVALRAQRVEEQLKKMAEAQARRELSY